MNKIITLILLYTGFLLSLISFMDVLPVHASMYQHPGLHKGQAAEVLQTGNYTYVLLKHDGANQWVAIPKTSIDTGEVYYYDKGILMPDFRSKELNRTFPSVLLLERLYPQPGKEIGRAHV